MEQLMQPMQFLPHSHCHFCGDVFDKKVNPQTSVEIQCRVCKQFTYKNPIPVAVLMIPTPTRRGLFLVQRGIEPKKGLFACPGGFMREGESWKVAAARETQEEIQITIKDPEQNITLVDVLGADPWKRTLIFGIVTRRSAIDVEPFQESEEALDRVFVENTANFPIAFPLHDLMIKRYLNGEFTYLLDHPNR